MAQPRAFTHFRQDSFLFSVTGRSAHNLVFPKAAFSGAPSPGHLVRKVYTGLCTHSSLPMRMGQPLSHTPATTAVSKSYHPSPRVTQRLNWAHWLSSDPSLPTSLRPISTKSASMSELTWYFFLFGHRIGPFSTQLPSSSRQFHTSCEILNTSLHHQASGSLSVEQGYLDQGHRAQACSKRMQS